MRQIPLLAVLTLVVFANPSWAQRIVQPPQTDMEFWGPVRERRKAAGRHVGPVVQVGGAHMAVEDPALPPPTDQEFKLFFDSPNMPSPERPVELLNSVAKFLNMHVEAGVPLENLQLAVVLHNTAAEGAFGNEAYRARFGVDNPNIPFFEALFEVGVKFYVCGQNAAAFGITKENKSEQVEIALSAMTAIAVLRSQGYQSVF